MSWNLNLQNVDDASLEAVAAENYADFKSRYTDSSGAVEAMDEQVIAAVAAARSLVAGVGGGPVTVTLSGHANPNHQNREGYAPESIHVSVATAR